MNPYLAMREKHSGEHDDFPLFFAFSDERFFIGLQRLGLSRDDVDQVVAIGAGGYCRKSDTERLKDMGTRHRTELAEAMKDENFAEQALTYELANHEYNYSMDTTEAIDALNLTEEQVKNDPMLRKVLQKAIRNQGDPF